MSRDYRDLVIEHLIEIEHEQQVRIADLESQLEIKDDIISSSLTHCHELTIQNGQLKRRLRQLTDAVFADRRQAA